MKAGVSSVSPSSERIKELWVVCGLELFYFVMISSELLSARLHPSQTFFWPVTQYFLSNEASSETTSHTRSLMNQRVISREKFPNRKNTGYQNPVLTSEKRR